LKLSIYELVGENCITKEDGQKVFDEIYPVLKSRNQVVLDFSKVNIFASPFFNFSIGQLFKDFSLEEIKALLETKSLSQDGNNVLERVIDNSIKYYSNDRAMEIQNEVIKEKSENE